MKVRYYFLFALVAVCAYAVVQDFRLGGGDDPQKTDTGVAIVSGREVKIEYVQKSKIYPAFGQSFVSTAEIREDLSPRVKRFVRAHELYHIGDAVYGGGWIGREIRANLMPALSDPVGFAFTVVASLSPDRLGFYWERFKRGW
ncbi:MAG: hypothetical protein Q8N81_08370 [bacterium]|nr:hypothetical protein [bacterium]